LTEEYSIPCPNCGKPIRTEKFCPGCGTANPINYIDESVKVSRTRAVRRQEKSRGFSRVMVMGIGVAVAVLVGTFLGNNYALNSMQFRVNDVSEFDIASMSSTIKLDACNPTVFPAGFDRFSAVIKYRQAEFARVTVDGDLVMPYQAATFDGEMSLSADIISGLVLALGEPGNSPYNENDMTVAMTMDAKILGIVPYSQSDEFSFSEFQQVAGEDQSAQYSCD
jgi:hypothetical protein